MTSSADGQDRLQEIWAEWSLTPDETMSKAQLGALDAVAKWLEAGQTDPEVMIRAVQLLLADPERPDVRQRASWVALRKAVQKKWTNAGTGKDHFFYAQALMLAAWPEKQTGWLGHTSLLDSAWVLRRGQEPKEIALWRMQQLTTEVKEEPQAIAAKTMAIAIAQPKISQFAGEIVNSAAEITHITQYTQHHYNNSSSQIATVLDRHEKALVNINAGLAAATKEASQLATALYNSSVNVNAQIKAISSELRQEMDAVLDAVRENTDSKLNLLWWGQSRYCRALRKPYLRLKSDPSALLWWTAREAAELSLSVDVEPAAAYLVETLHNLDQNIDEKKPVLEWMKELDATLKKASEKVLPLSGRLDKIANEDALGLPVTWVRRRRMLRDDFDVEAAKNDVALNLDEEIDRGDWASWVFRETLLDLHLREENQ